MRKVASVVVSDEEDSSSSDEDTPPVEETDADADAEGDQVQRPSHAAAVEAAAFPPAYPNSEVLPDVDNDVFAAAAVSPVLKGSCAHPGTGLAGPNPLAAQAAAMPAPYPDALGLLKRKLSETCTSPSAPATVSKQPVKSARDAYVPTASGTLSDVWKKMKTFDVSKASSAGVALKPVSPIELLVSAGGEVYARQTKEQSDAMVRASCTQGWPRAGSSHRVHHPKEAE